MTVSLNNNVAQSCMTLKLKNNKQIKLHYNHGLLAIKARFIVNAAKPSLEGGGGIDKVVHKAAGPSLLKACKKIKLDNKKVRCPTGDVRITHAGKLPHAAIFHTVGPKLKDAKGKVIKLTKQHKKELEKTYKNTLKMVDEYCNFVKNPQGKHPSFFKKIQSKHEAALRSKLSNNQGISVAFPCISTGSYSFPPEKAARIAIKTLVNYLQKHPKSSIKTCHIACLSGQADIVPLQAELKKIK